MRKLLIPVIAVLTLIVFTGSGCKPENFQEVEVDGRYALWVPNYLSKGKELNEEASLQYQNEYKEVYVIVIDESKDEFVKLFKQIKEYDDTKSAGQNYAEKQLAMIEGNMETVTKKSTVRVTEIDGCEARIVDVAGTQENIPEAMGFTVAFVEGEETLYMIMAWTYEKTKALYQDDMNEMIDSFEEL